MKIVEMEPQIDAMGLKKLEVKLGRGGQVINWVCASDAKEDEGKYTGHLIVFDASGRAYSTGHVEWNDETLWSINTAIKNGRPLTINGHHLIRWSQYDLKAQ